VIYQISSGQGPAECELGVSKLWDYLQSHYDVTLLDTSQGYYAETFRSIRLYSEDDLAEYVGSVQWICRSPYRSNHKRKNWFIDFQLCETVRTDAFDPEQVVFDTFRSGGKGGQNVNKVESGVRAIYLPTGQAVVCTEERSQYANKQKALSRLQALVQKSEQDQQAQQKNQACRHHTRLERGNAQVRFEGPGFRRA